jgi:hypothetical protein
MRLRSITRLWVVALGLAGCGATDVGRAPVFVDRVVASSPGDEAVLREAVTGALGRGREFTAASGGLGGALRLGAWLSPSDQSGPQSSMTPSELRPATLFLHIELEVPATLRSQFDVPTITAQAGLPDAAVSGPALAHAAGAALEVLELRLDLAAGKSEAAVGLLKAEDPEIRLLALEWVRDHPGVGLADAVAAQLESATPEVVVLALEVLAVVGDERHAGAVVRRVERSPGLAREGYRALAALGGPDAVGFLRFATDNEDEPGLRAEAERALATALLGPGERVAARSLGVDLPRVARGHR